MKRDEMEKAIRDLLAATELPESEIMSDTAERVAKAWEEELLSGYAMNPSEAVGELIPATEDEKSTVVMKGIKFHSMCSHHLLPFQGTVALGYQPGEGGILGLGSLDTIVQIFAKRLQTQEKLTREIVDALDSVVDNEGIGIIIEADHACMQARGPKSSGKTVTSHFTGCFENEEKKNEFVNMVGISDK
tara:strand:+ start:13719 stop:14285 length:567 start_codon:yes stop_codon:yes gene_type:complete